LFAAAAAAIFLFSVRIYDAKKGEEEGGGGDHPATTLTIGMSILPSPGQPSFSKHGQLKLLLVVHRRFGSEL
jgi:hypothetical protein